jgi:transcriptional regulator GlxA family with amidase domain
MTGSTCIWPMTFRFRSWPSERSFSRHYAEATGLTPARPIERLRVEAARRLLSESRLPIKRI